MAAVSVEDAYKMLEGKVNIQLLMNQDEKIRSLLDIAKKKRDFLVKDKEE